MSTSSRRLSQRSKHNRNMSTPGREKGGSCVRPKDHGTATAGNPYKGAGMKGNQAATFDRLWGRYYQLNGMKAKA